ncbi:LA2681 family HEPN domain-containing protein [Enterococcus devriesei]|uniref:LA2681 family HEPN domain-containing protein n=1 Tax=Enterococcus devriesei TaxID=319970 RepID=UPI0028A7BC0A|nr:LA2681 family HEPN domain-containing protein [Enterococcus devriesei]
MWYEDASLNLMSEDCDLAYDNRNGKLLLELSEKCRIFAEDKNRHIMFRAKLYYDGFTSLSNYTEITDLDKIDKEKYTEKILYLCRKSLVLQEKYATENIMEAIEEANFNGIYFQTIVNYCNILSHIGRLPKAIYENRKIAIQGFGMAIGNLGMELYDYGYFDYDTGHQHLILEKVCSLFKEAIDYSDRYVHSEAKQHFTKRLERIIGNDNFEEKTRKIPNLNFYYPLCPECSNDFKSDGSNEYDYRTWVAQNCLALNTLNDLDYSVNQAYDPIHLPGMLANISERYPRFHGLFNQIKQEYCSARFMIYEGLQNPKWEPHFSDKDVFLINTLDYPVYGLNIEIVKSAYRTIYSLFDRIGYFLNEYYSLGLSQRKVSFGAIWGNSTNLIEIAESNYLLKALYWIKKDLYGNSVSDYKDHIDPMLNRTYKIRNIMEHQYLKILSDTNFFQDDSKIDELATSISIEEFHELAINLLRTCREAVILLVMLINVEEKRKKDDLEGSVLPDINLPEYKDEWKF